MARTPEEQEAVAKEWLAYGHNSRMSQPLFEVVDLTKHYGSNAVVSQLSFSIAPGECLGVIGPNGAGKTTPSACA